MSPGSLVVSPTAEIALNVIMAHQKCVTTSQEVANASHAGRDPNAKWSLCMYRK